MQKALKNDGQASEITKFFGRILGEEIVDEVYNIFRSQTCSITQRKLMITANEEAGGDITSAGAESSLGQVLGPPIGANFNMKITNFIL